MPYTATDKPCFLPGFPFIGTLLDQNNALWDLTQGLFIVSGWRTKFNIGRLFFSTVYISIIPSPIVVKRGYEASHNTVLILPNKTTLTLDELGSLQGSLYYTICKGNIAEPTICAESHIEFNECWIQASEDYGMAYQPRRRYSAYAEMPQIYNCFAKDNKYDWGFSGEWVLIVGCVNRVWLFGLWVLWLACHTQWCKSAKMGGEWVCIKQSLT